MLTGIFKERSIAFKFAVYLSLFLIILVGLTGYWYFHHITNQALSHGKERLESLSTIVQSNFERKIEQFVLESHQVNSFAQAKLTQSDLDSVAAFYQQNKQLGPLFILSAKGNIAYTRMALHLPYEVISINNAVLSRKLAKEWWSNIVYMSEIESWVNLYYMPLKVEETVVAYVVTAFDVDSSIKQAKERVDNGQASLFIFDSERQLVFHPDYGSRLIRQIESQTDVSVTGQIIRKSIQSFIDKKHEPGAIVDFYDWGVKHLAITKKLVISDWTIVIYQSEQKLFSQITDVNFTFFMALLSGGVLLYIIIILLISNLVTKRLKATSSILTRAKSGHLELREVVNGHDEVDIVNNHINNLFSRFQEQLANKDSELTHLHDKLEEYKALAQAVSFSDNAVIMIELDYTISFVDTQTLNLMGTERDNLIGQRFFNLIHPYMAFLPEQIMNDIRRNESWRGELVLDTGVEDAQIWVNATITPLRNELGGVTKYVVSLQDISFIKDSESMIEQLAYTDELTGLSNRSFFKAQLEKLVEINKREHYEFVLMHVDIDDFKRINDTFGYEGGDELLTKVAERMKAHLRSEDVIARIAGDEFALILGGVDTEQKVLVMLNNILSFMQEPFEIKGKMINACCSIGLTMSKTDVQDAELLLQHANMAMYEAKSIGKNTFHFFTEELNELVRERINIEQALKTAIINGELELHYQPKVDVVQNKLVGFEALLRWNSAELGAVGPHKFIPIAEQSNLILDISEWVIEKAARFIANLDTPVPVSINISAKQFEAGNTFQLLKHVIEHYHIDPSFIEVEITESELMTNVAKAIEQLKQLKSLGVAIAIDDFGTGYSSLNYLKQFPLDTLKIDRSFIKDIPSEKSDMEITSAVIAIGQALGLSVIAEGVETKEQLEFVKSKGCVLIQGYYYSKPVPESVALDWQVE